MHRGIVREWNRPPAYLSVPIQNGNRHLGVPHCRRVLSDRFHNAGLSEPRFPFPLSPFPFWDHHRRPTKSADASESNGQTTVAQVARLHGRASLKLGIRFRIASALTKMK